MKTGPAIDQLNSKQYLFVKALVAGSNQTQVYMQAYGQDNPDTAKSNASLLMTKSNVSEAIREEKAALDHASNFTREHVIGIRKEVAMNPEARNSDRLTACRDHTKTMGWDKDKHQDPASTPTINLLYVQTSPADTPGPGPAKAIDI